MPGIGAVFDGRFEVLGKGVSGVEVGAAGAVACVAEDASAFAEVWGEGAAGDFAAAIGAGVCWQMVHWHLRGGCVRVVGLGG